MNGGGFKPSLAARIAAFIKRSRQNTAVRRITNVMAVFVVFITTYMMILPAITLETEDLSPTLSVKTITADNVEYNGTAYTAELTVTISAIDDADSTTTYYVIFPDGVSITNYSGSTLTGTSTINGQTVDAFTYEYKYDEDGTLYAEVQFLQSYLDAAGTDLEDGWFYFDATIDSSNEGADYNVVLQTGSVTYTIKSTDITSTDNSSNPAGDVDVAKTSSSYNKDTNSITYTLTVSTEKGTQSAISILDTISSGTLGVSSVSVDSIVLSYDTDAWGNKETISTITDSATLSLLYTYDASTGEIVMTLDALTNGNGYGSQYVITYTVYLDTITDYSTSETVSNEVTASADTGWPGTSDPTVTSDSEATATVSYNVLSKTGTADSDGNITWVITVNADGVNIYGLTLTDEMFSQFQAYELAAGIAGGSWDDNYNFVYGSDNKVIGITFIDNNGSQTNTGTYTITYTTSAASAWADGSVTTSNTATLSGDSLSSGISKTVGVTTQSGGIGKTVDESATTYSNDGNYVYLTWTAAATIPSGGIAKGTILYDYLGGSAYASQTTQWFTYAQIADSTARNTWYSMGLTYSSGQVDTLNYNLDYSVEFYCTDTGTWVSLQDLVSNESTYTNCHFTAIRITFLKDITVSGSATLSLTYTTTADRSTIDGSSVTYITYTNNLEVQGTTTLYGSASHTEYAYVIKTDGSGKSGSTSTTVDADGTLTWIVKAYVPAGTTDIYYIITDTLPENVELTSVNVEASWTSCTLTPNMNGELSGVLNGGTITGTVVTDNSGGTDVQVVTVTIPDTSYSGLVSSGGYITLTYTCQLDSSRLTDNGDPLADGTVVGTFGNSVSVSTSGSASFGTAAQAQTVTYYENTGTGTDDTVTKNYVWSSDTSRLTYTVVINPDAEMLANGENLSFEDILTVNHATDWGVYAQLVNATVKFYEAVSDGNGGYEKGNELDIAWTYTQSSADNTSYISIFHTITSDSVPDGTAIILEYVYEVWLDPYDAAQAASGLTSYNITGVGNSMTLEGSYTDSTNTTNADSYTDSHMAAGIGTTGNYLMLVKVEDGNYSTTISGAVYTLYKYNGTDWDAIGTYTTGTDGTFVISKSSLGDDYATDTAFKLVETEAPIGYILDSQTEYYFYWSGTGTISSPADGDGWDSVSAVNLTKTADTLYANNTAVPEDTTTSVTVEKEWVDSSGNAITSDLPSDVSLTLYKYEESDVAGSAGGGASAADTVNVYFVYGAAIYAYANPVTVKTEAVEKGEDFTLSIDAGDGYTISYYSLYTYAAYNYSEISGYSSWTSPGQTLSLTVDGSVVTQDIYVLYYTSTYSSESYGTVSVGSGGGTSLSGVTASSLPKDDKGDYAGVAYGTYTLTATNGWTLTVDNLPYEVYDANGELHTYYYYFIEEAMDGYYTTYSSSEGVTNGGMITITNTQIPTTDITVTKKWYDSGGTEITDPTKLTLYDSNGNVISNVSDMSITVNLYRTTAVEDSGTGTAGGGTATNTVTVTVQNNSGTTLATKDVPEGDKVTIAIEIPAYTTVYVYYGSGWTYYDGWYNGNSGTETQYITIDEATEDITYYLTATVDVTITCASEVASSSPASTSGTYTDSELPADGELIGTYTITPTYDTGTGTWSWSYTVTDLPTIGVADDGSIVTYAYYFREDTVRGYTATYDSDGSTEGTITISNTASEQYYTKAKVEKKWYDSSGNEITDLDSYTTTFQLWQALYDETNSKYVDDGDGNYILTAYGSPVTLSGSNTTDWSNTWTNLPTTATYNSETYTCVYFLTETSASDGGTATFTVSYGASSEATGQAAGAVSENLVVYDTDNFTVLATYYFVTYGNTTGDSTNPAAPATVVVTNTSSETKTQPQTIEFTVAKTFVKDSASYAPTANTTVTFTLLQVLTYDDSGTETVYDTNKSTDITYEKTVTFDGSAVSATASWSDLPATLDVDISGTTTTCDCTYYIVETKVENANSVDITSQYTAGYTVGTATPDTYTVTDAGSGVSVTYYKVSDGETLTVTNTQESIILPMTGGLGADRMIVFLGCGLALLAVCIFFVRRRILCGGGDCET